MKDQFFTLGAPSTGYFMDKGSKFHAYAFPLEDEAQAAVHMQQVKKLHPKARHYCTALRLHPDASLERSSDDGEPSGSAGRPILGQLLKYNLTNVYLIVVRYFGGTKLGIPGLIEAYKSSAQDALSKASITERQVYGLVKMKLSYETYPAFNNQLKHQGILILEETFDETISLMIGFRKSMLMESVLDLLHQFSRMDFATVSAYAEHLGMEIQILEDVVIR